MNNKEKNHSAQTVNEGEKKKEKQHESKEINDLGRTLNPSALMNSNHDATLQVRTTNSEAFKTNDVNEKTDVSPVDPGSMDRYR